MHLMPLRPLGDAELRISDQIGGQKIRPVRERRLKGLQATPQRANSSFGTSFRQTHDVVGVVKLSENRLTPIVCDRQHQYLRSVRTKPIEVALIVAMNDDVALRETMAPGIAGFDVTAPQDDCGVGRVVSMPVKELFCGMPGSARHAHAHRSAAALAM
jgi:hypothetical protein